MEVFCVFDVRKYLLVGISLVARLCKLNTQSLAHAIPCLTTCLSCLVLQMGKMRHRSFCDIPDLSTVSLKHACSGVVGCSKPVHHSGHSLLTLKCALMTVLQTAAVGSDARDLSMTLFFLSSSVCAEKQQSSQRSLFVEVKKQIAICRYAGLGCSLGCIALSCNCYCHATVLRPSWLFLLYSCPSKNNPRMCLCRKTSYGTLFLDTEQLQIIKQYWAWIELLSLLPWVHM